MFLSDISIRRPVFATMMMVTLVVLGIVAYKRLSLDEYPDALDIVRQGQGVKVHVTPGRATA